jgi:hypothetical protein
MGAKLSPLTIFVDNRLGGCPPRYILARSGDFLMQIPDAIRSCVAFVGYRKQPSGPLHLLGTAFFIFVRTLEEAAGRYAVTAKHVIHKVKERSFDGKLIIRCNRVKAPASELETSVADWTEHPSSTADVAAIPLLMPGRLWHHAYISVEMAVTPKVISDENISLGDEVFFVGLFTKHSGKSRNIPIIRVGNIACMPEEPVKTKDYGLIDAYLVESRSTGGMSGSPVFVEVSGARRSSGGGVIFDNQPRCWLLGLVHGHWDIENVSSVDDKGVNMGIAVVVPSERIVEMLNIPEFVEARRLADEAWIVNNSATPDSEPPEWNDGLVEDRPS